MPTTLLAAAAKSAAGPGTRAARAVDALPHIPSNLSDVERAGSAAVGAAVIALGFDAKGPGLASLLSGGYLLYRAATGHCPVYQALNVSTAPELPKVRGLAMKQAAGHEVSHAVTINRPAPEIYNFWRDYRNLPKVMTHLVRVDGTGAKSHWVARGPLGMTFEWDAETTLDITNREIAWRSVEGADVDTTGSVQFKELPHGRGTEVRLTMRYAPPGGKAGVLISKLFGQSPDAQIKADLRNVKNLLETGEIPTVTGQTSGRR